MEAFEACSLPDLGDSPLEVMLTPAPLVVETHNSYVEKPERGRVKRIRTPSPLQSPNNSGTSGLSKRSSSLDRHKAPKDKKKKEKDKSSSGKPFLNRPLESRSGGRKT